MHSIKLLSKAALPLLVTILVALISGTNRTNAGGLLNPAAQSAAASLTGEFTFHGQLAKNGGAYTGTCNFTFSLWDAASSGAQIGSTQTVSSVSVSGGVFS